MPYLLTFSLITIKIIYFLIKRLTRPRYQVDSSINNVEDAFIYSHALHSLWSMVITNTGDIHDNKKYCPNSTYVESSTKQTSGFFIYSF